ncbi:MAG TPA: LLM class F420-dependent oxidoreductase [Candidatus Binatia bacterium]|nr:LLM class F420-dependent oxidoreductase [Candidatus Binatia bacterium]
MALAPLVRFGIQTPQEGVRFEDLVRHWREADALGYDSLWIDDHFYPVVRPRDEPQLESWTLLAALARATERVGIGILVSCNSYRPPALLAKMAATLDVVSDGRLLHGMGAGWFEHEYRAYGYDFPPIGTRLAQLDESLRLQKRLWTEDRVTFAGRWYRAEDALCHPKPVQKPYPPIVVGGGGERKLLRLVARHADVWNNGGTVEELGHKLEVLRGHCAAEGRDFDAIEKSWFGNVVVDADPARARDRLERMARAWGTSPEDMRRRSLAGTPEEVIERVREYLAIGVTYFIGMFGRVDDLRSTRLFAEKVLPVFQDVEPSRA